MRDFDTRFVCGCMLHSSFIDDDDIKMIEYILETAYTMILSPTTIIDGARLICLRS